MTDLSIIRDAAAYIRKSIADVGGCEHDVGHCVCADVRLAERLEAELQPCGECHLKPNETCDICGRRAPAPLPQDGQP